MVVQRRASSGASPELVPSTSAKMKYRPVIETGRSAAKGTKPLPNPVTVPEIFTKVMIHCCKRVLYVDPKIRVMAYIVLLFFVSLVTDYMPFPRTYFSNPGNFLNQVFVKYSWGWTFVFVAIFIVLTSTVYCCGDKKQVGRHLIRLAIATMIWYVWTSLFVTIEEITGKCVFGGPTTGLPAEAVYSKGRRPCLKSGGKWTSFDISGHSFLLIWCVFFIIEETKPIIGWDVIEDHIRNEDHKRSRVLNPEELPETALSNLSNEEFLNMKKWYKMFGIWVKMAVVVLTFLVLIWDIMLIMTACYFHIMIEKVIGGLLAIIMWSLTYRTFYKMNVGFSPGMPGIGTFKYSNIYSGVPTKTQVTATKTKVKDMEEIPTFMGMPLYALKNKPKDHTEGIRIPIVSSK